jgi:hypothetical protein
LPPQQRGQVGRALRIGCAGVASAVVAAAFLLALVHLDDRYRLDQVGGTWTALATYANEGTLYPPLYDGERFGGTRYMPLQIGLHAGLARLTGDELLAGKLLALLVAAALLAVLLDVLVRELGVPLWVSLTLVAALVASPLGVLTVTSIRGDALTVVLQLTALTVVSRFSRPAGAVGAGVLCAAAVLAKLSGLWGAAAIVGWLLLCRDRRRLAHFVAGFAAPLAVVLALVEVFTRGRFSDNVFGLSAASAYGPMDALRIVPTKLFTLLDVGADPVSLLLPLAVVGLVLAARARTVRSYHVAFVAASVVTLGLLADPGTTYNHLLDVGVLTVVLVGILWAEQARAAAGARTVVTLLVPAVALWAAAGSYALGLHVEVKEAASIAIGRSSASYPRDPLAGRISADESLLSEEPWIPVSLDRLPTVLDPYALLRLADEHPDWEAELVARLDGRAFDWVLLRYDHVAADGRIDVSAPWWQNQNFGPTIVAAIARNYRFRDVVEGYALYAPR